MIRSNLGNVYKTKRWAERFARGRPVRRVPGGWKIYAGRKKTKGVIVARKRRKSSRKTYKKKSTAKNKAGRGRSVYKVRGGWRIGKRRRR